MSTSWWKGDGWLENAVQKTMKQLAELVAIAKEMLDDVGCPYRRFNIKSSARLTKCWGNCRSRRDAEGRYFDIKISEILLKDDVDDYAPLNTVAHEIIHTVEGCLNHGLEWRFWAAKINERYGLHIKRVTSAEEKGAAVMEWRSTTWKYRAYCPECGREWRRNKICDIIRYAGNYHCPDCHCALKSEGRG